MWEVVMLDEVERWYLALDDTTLVNAAIDRLAEAGPGLGRPTADSITGSELHKLKELRAGKSIRILFVFDPQRQAILLVAGDKAGQWKRWYRDNIPVAESRYEKWLEGHYDNERK